jgi:hypothetical protein
MFAILPCVDNYAGVLNEQTQKKRLEFLAKGEHNFEFNFSLGHNFSQATYNTGLKAKIFSAKGEIVLYDPEKKNSFYSLPTLSTPSAKISMDDFDQSGFHSFLDLNDNLGIKFLGSVFPLQFDSNYIYNRFFKIGISGQAAIGIYYLFSSTNLGKCLRNYKQDKKTSEFILLERFEQTYLKKKLSIDYRTYLNLGVKLFDYNPYALWINLQNGFAFNFGNKLLGECLIKGYTGNLFLSLEKYLSRNIKIFYNLGGGFNVYHNGKPFDEEGKNKLTIWNWSLLNFSFGFSFGSNDGRYEDYIYQKREYDYYIDKYQRTFDYYDEYVPLPEE